MKLFPITRDNQIFLFILAAIFHLWDILTTWAALWLGASEKMVVAGIFLDSFGRGGLIIQKGMVFALFYLLWRASRQYQRTINLSYTIPLALLLTGFLAAARNTWNILSSFL